MKNKIFGILLLLIMLEFISHKAGAVGIQGRGHRQGVSDSGTDDSVFKCTQ